MQKNNAESSRRLHDIIFYSLGLLAVFSYLSIIYQHALDIPKWDDFQEILQFINQWVQAGSLAGKYDAFVSHSNEHILLTTHLIALLQYELCGHLDFAWLIYIGNFFYIGSALTLWLFYKQHPERAFIFCILMLTGVTFYTYDSTLWAMTALSNQAVICFALLAIYLATQTSIIMPRVMAVTFLSVFSQSNGLFLLPIIGIYFWQSKHKKESMQWIVFSLLIVVIYAYWFHQGTHEQNSSLEILPKIPLLNYLLIPVAGISYFGASIFAKADAISIIFSFLFGAIILTITYHQLKEKSYDRRIVVISAFLLASILSIIMFRGIIVGPGVAFVSRYKMYSTYFLAIAVLLSPLLLEKTRRVTLWRYGILGLSVLFNIWSYPLNMAQSQLIDGDLYKSLQHWVEDGDLRNARGFFVRDADSYLFAALKNKTYNPLVLIPQEQILPAPAVLTACPVSNDVSMEKRNVALLTHKNPNAAGIRVDPLRDMSNAVILTLCTEPSTVEPSTAETMDSRSHFYQVNIPPHQGAVETGYFLAREQIAPGDYRVFMQEGVITWQQEPLFKNKKNTR